MRTVKAMLITVTGLLLCLPAYAQMNAGAEVEMAVINTDAGEGGQTFSQLKADISLNYSKDKVTGLVQFDVFAPKTGATATTTQDDAGADVTTYSVTSNMIDDAWMQYAFADTFKLKMGLESVYNNFYGRLSNAWTSTATADTSVYNSHFAYGTPTEMIEVSGAAAGVTYGLQLWEDVDPGTTDDGKDLDDGLGTNMSLLVKYNMPILEAGLIYYSNKGYKNDAEETKDRTGHQLFVKYINAGLKLDAYLRRHQSPISEYEDEGTSHIVGVGYKPLDILAVGFAYNMISPVVTVKNAAGDIDGVKADGFNVMDLNISYIVAPELNYYVQYTAIGESAEKGSVAKAYNNIALGMAAKI